MKLYVISFTSRGRELAGKIADFLTDHQVTLFQGQGQEKITLKEFAQRGFREAEGLIFISATGIAVRAIAPVLQHKLKDPAVVVLDDDGQFAISLLSGHWGGANELTEELAAGTGATPVVTTATDRYGLFAVDNFARHNGFSLVHPNKIKEVSGALLRKERVKVYSTFPVEHLAEGLEQTEQMEEATLIFDSVPHPETLTLIPRDYVLGMGCRKDTSPQEVEEFAQSMLDHQGITVEELRGLTSVDLKAEEPAMLALAKKWDLPFFTFTSEELNAIPGEFTPSTFVLEQVGTDNVCERSAVALGGGTLVLKKQIHRGITLALAKETRVIAMEDFGKN